MRLTEIDPGAHFPVTCRMVVEIPRDSSNTYEYDPELEVFRLDRPLYSPVQYPGDYGFIPSTVAEDGDPLDVLCFVQEPSHSGCVIEVRSIGTLVMTDQDQIDQKVIAVPSRSPRHERILSFEDIEPHIRREIEHFFSIYKELEGKRAELRGWKGTAECHEIMARSRERAG